MKAIPPSPEAVKAAEEAAKAAEEAAEEVAAAIQQGARSVATPMTAPVVPVMTRTVPIGSIPPGGKDPLWSAEELTGVWVMCCPGGCSITEHSAEGDDVKFETGVCCTFGIPLGMNADRWTRKGDTNTFECGPAEETFMSRRTSCQSVCNDPGWKFGFVFRLPVTDAFIDSLHRQ